MMINFLNHCDFRELRPEGIVIITFKIKMATLGYHPSFGHTKISYQVGYIFHDTPIHIPHFDGQIM